ncbi:CDP-glycerol glycerophosphotransferase family protein [Perlabentimonas gracilis]|uniref:CDP-glycerol glycerophosphotransferase family protein n=1 Tax=Perlabentimonas gracilis TaxID=2715279 RepID=UPI00140D1615|nr:CDP-glycerol glycerophosphotransferase family protein [Perlabentimonas gracilis]NHB69843.1 CDP-glycerol--glycerophosphate glycerophosphotransferase [Perlabentimonas gracilis]
MTNRPLPMFLVKQIIKNFYSWIFNTLYIPIIIKVAPYIHTKSVIKIRKKEKIKVAFLLIHESVWKYDGVYWLMENDKRFEPVIIICPYVSYEMGTMEKEMNKAYSSFKEKGYNVIKTFNENNGKWLNIKREVKPDIIFFTSPYSLTKRRFTILNFKNYLSFYVPYGYMITDRPEMQYNQTLHNLVYRVFHESNFHNVQAQKFSTNRGKNSIVTGYPGLDQFFSPNKVKPESIWKNKNLKRIIWAPHHTIEQENSQFNYSNFLEYYDFFLEIADKYQDKITISFKPHPILRAKLNKHHSWGEEKTDNYYKKWKERVNCQLDEGDYIDLFNTSDAMIHDSGSFLTEYISTNKPSLYMIRHDLLLSGFSELGNKIIDCHYKSNSKEEVEMFIKEVVIEGNDYLKNKRESLIHKYLLPPIGKNASQNIMNEINDVIGKNITQL